MRISPFSEARDVMPDPKRVNLWPLIYQNQDHTSALWPVVDVDPNGFAVRPVLNKEKNDWSVLFPLSSYNAERKVGWLGPGGYNFKDYWRMGLPLDFIIVIVGVFMISKVWPL